MSTQLALFPETSVGERRLPKIDRIDIPFTWERVDYLINLPSSDFWEEGLSKEWNRDVKRTDYGYERLLEDIRVNGYVDPVFVYPPGEGYAAEDDTEQLGNGHHRVVAAFDLGYTHIPVTRDESYQWSEHGSTTR